MTAEKRGVLCATSTLELGIDIGDIDAVVLFRPPFSISSLLQRIGRGNRRSGRHGCRDRRCHWQRRHSIASWSNDERWSRIRRRFHQCHWWRCCNDCRCSNRRWRTSNGRARQFGWSRVEWWRCCGKWRREHCWQRHEHHTRGQWQPRSVSRQRRLRLPNSVGSQFTLRFRNESISSGPRVRSVASSPTCEARAQLDTRILHVAVAIHATCWSRTNVVWQTSRPSLKGQARVRGNFTYPCRPNNKQRHPSFTAPR